jgi:glucose-1-phosphate cytidylyltransferase
MTDQLSVSEIPVVILCGGMGTRLREASGDKVPKPLVDIGGRPILWHVMKMYRAHGFRKFVLCLGYKGDLIKRYFLDYREHLSDFTLTHDGSTPQFHSSAAVEDWEITFVETGLQTATAERVKRVAKHLTADHFMLTYGDGIGDVDLTALVQKPPGPGPDRHRDRRPPREPVRRDARQRDAVSEFNEKPTLATGWVNGGFFMFQRSFIEKYLSTSTSP